MSSAGWFKRFRLGPILFVLLLAGLIGQFVYRHTNKADTLNDEAVELMNFGKYDSAIEKLDEALEGKPDHVAATYHRGICLAEKHRWEEAIEAFDRTAELDPREAKAPFNKGKVLWYTNRFDEAIGPLEKATELQSRYPDAWALLAECLYEKYLQEVIAKVEPPPSPARAIAAFKTYLKQRPDAGERTAVERKLEILADITKFPEVLEKRIPPPPDTK